MAFTKEEKRKLDNYREHYNSILGNINAANETLETIFKEIQITKNDIELLRQEKEDIRTFTQEFEAFKECTERALEIREASLEEGEKNLKEGHELLQDWKARTEKEVGEILTKSENIFKDLENKIKLNNQVLLDLNEDADILSKKITTEESSLEELRKEKRETEEDIRKNLNLLTGETGRLNKEITKKEKELEKLELKVSKEQEKIGSADKSILEREKKLKIKEHDLYILTTRIRKAHKKYFPDKELII